MTTVELIKSAVPYGRENAIRRCDLAHKLGLPDRSMRKAIEDARNEGYAQHRLQQTAYRKVFVIHIDPLGYRIGIFYTPALPQSTKESFQTCTTNRLLPQGDIKKSSAEALLFLYIRGTASLL